MREPTESGNSAEGSSAAEFDREVIAADMSAMAFRRLDPDGPIDLHGDEVVSIFDRLRTRYGVDHDRFWAQIDFDRHFHRELHGCFPVALLVAWIMSRFGAATSRRTGEVPFTTDDLVRVMRAARRERGSIATNGRSSP